MAANPLSMLLSFVSFAARNAPQIAEDLRELLKVFGKAKGIPESELQPALDDTLTERVSEADEEVDRLVSDLYK
jgi:hypothetical protein